MSTLDDLLVTGARRQQRRLRQLELPSPSRAFTAARAALLASVDAAIDRRTALEPGDVIYTAGLYTAMGATGEWRHLNNQWGLGVGTPTPRIIAMGTEAADNPWDDYAAWLSGYTILALSGGSARIAARLAEGLADPKWQDLETTLGGIGMHDRRPHVLLHSFGWKLTPRHTWALLARAVGLEREDLDGLFDTAFLIERSVHSSRQSSGGIPPTADRVAWLQEVVGTLSTARVLLVYGAAWADSWPEDEEHAHMWAWANREVTKAHLGLDRLTSPVLHTHSTGDGSPQHVAEFRHGSRSAIWCRALSGRNVSDGYVNLVRDVVAGGLAPVV